MCRKILTNNRKTQTIDIHFKQQGYARHLRRSRAGVAPAVLYYSRNNAANLAGPLLFRPSSAN